MKYENSLLVGLTHIALSGKYSFMDSRFEKCIIQAWNTTCSIFGFGGFLVVILFVTILCAPTSVRAAPRVFFTIDVESNEMFTLPEQVDAVCKDGSTCGLMEIVRMLQERGWAGTFFLNVYEYRRWEEAAMRDITVKLQSAGQDVALHTHPQWAYDPSRWAMFGYNLDEQTTIIHDGVRLLEAWTGRPVVAHRAGAYTADQHTLEALERNGIRVDSSLFWEHPWSHLNGLGLPRNLPSTWGQLIQIPVTVYQREGRPALFADFLSPATSIRKIDPNWFLNKEEAISAIDAVIDADLPLLVVFLHSFSFMEGQGDGGVPLADRHPRDLFRAILDHIAEKRLPVMTMRDLAESETLPAISPDRDVIPRVTVRMDLHRYFLYRLKTAGTGALGVGAVVFTLVVGGTVLLITARRRRLVVGAK